MHTHTEVQRRVVNRQFTSAGQGSTLYWFVISIVVGLMLTESSFAGDKSSVQARPGEKGKRMEVMCHRGANLLAPENTFASAKKAIELGADYIEIDVRTTADGEMVIMHNPTVDHTTNGKGSVRQLTAAQIETLDAGSWFSPAFKGEHVPKLRPFLEWIRGKAKVYMDVKDALHSQSSKNDLDKFIKGK